MTDSDKQLALAAGLTAKTNQLCQGLESGAADILELVTPTTADLLA
jgi:type III restriction enzyme